MNKVERFEHEVKKRFVKEPGQMKLLIVVDKLLTGFDAPSATYLYIDKHMQDHGLFQRSAVSTASTARTKKLDMSSTTRTYSARWSSRYRTIPVKHSAGTMRPM